MCCSFDDITSLGESHSLTEISLDGNPLAGENGYKQTVLRNMQHLRQLDMKRVSVSMVTFYTHFLIATLLLVFLLVVGIAGLFIFICVNFESLILHLGHDS